MALYVAWGFDITAGIPTYDDPDPKQQILYDRPFSAYLLADKLQGWYNTVIAHGDANLKKDFAAKNTTLQQFKADFIQLMRLVQGGQTTLKVTKEADTDNKLTPLSPFYRKYYKICGNLPFIPIRHAHFVVKSRWDMIQQSSGIFTVTEKVGHTQTDSEIAKIGASIGASAGVDAAGVSAQLSTELTAELGTTHTVSIESSTTQTTQFDSHGETVKIFQLSMVYHDAVIDKDVLVEKMPIFRTCSAHSCD
ncbi:hypothetical protein [Cyclobacterium plantarum]|uniref:hypothetical protein n=1 Tax=Cyclobacterium plantarum TaxID=2716263 RepID=UPI003F6E756D